MGMIRIALSGLFLVAAPLAGAAEPSLADALECRLPADTALTVLAAAGVPVDGTDAKPVKAIAYGASVRTASVYRSRDEVGLTYHIPASSLGAFIKAAKLEQWEDEDGAGAHRALLDGRNALNTGHPDDLADATEADIECRMSFGGAL
ncbi:TPA: hypothetical protein HH296_15715 [Xanthomonas vasicola pv. zeae]|uniref:Uncharacterized protein n=2 Tax=Xanthomonas TaxID=338 RepID=A0A836P3X6_XANVA|nr:hypothetical protein B7L66_24455 [Xanthomonas citri pv. citri]MBV6747287.1 hypothetical protein [Xanthomonas vasicola pv. vasculorum NCPPB 890]MBV6892777.1 hypothetical protein [Xanthomonas vasicola pv. vasculorum]HHZ23859.1 hypothetical protein [Xanthomonas vasicola pv. zeae]ARR20066.1 hypothetical protein B7L65_24810 [Xanthomonas citri pv. citri]